MMTPLLFEQTYEAEWSELESLLLVLTGAPPQTAAPGAASAARTAALYRRACEHLAVARARRYPPYIVDRLDVMTAKAHQLIYRRREIGLARIRDFVTSGFPCAVRRHRRYVALSAATFLLPALFLGLLVYRRPELILSVIRADSVASFDEMYSPSAQSIGRIRTATTDWVMFAFYIRNNIGVAFQCFAGGLFAGIGSLFFLAYNGAFSGALAGYLTEHGLSRTFYSFVVTHAAFELTAIVLAGAAGIRVGLALVVPGRLRRLDALVRAGRESADLLYGVTLLLIVAAAVEAFWSSAAWLPLTLKYSVAAVCWIAVVGYFTLQGRNAD